MARVIEHDDIDWGSYEAATELEVKICPASIFADQLVAHFAPKKPGARRARMTSTKLRTCIDFRPAEVTVWAGYNGSRKSMFLGQAVIDLCAMGEKVLVASLEMLPAETLARMARQCFGCSTPSERQLRGFSDWTDERLWIFNHFGRLSPAKVLTIARFHADKLAGTHLVIDSMMMVCASEESLDEQKQLMTDLVRIAQETGLHIHLVAHCRKPPGDDDSKPPTKYALRGSAAISDQAHNVIMVWANKAKKAALEACPHDEVWLEKPDALVCVEKQRNGAFEGKVKLWCDEASFRFTDERTTPIEPYPIEELS
jgi:twinkle protein